MREPWIPTSPLASTQPQFGKGRIVSANTTFEMPSIMKNTIRSSAIVTRACSRLNRLWRRAFCPSWNEERAMLTDGAWMDLEPLIEACRPKGKTPPQDLRRTISAIVWRHQNGAKGRAIPADLGPWSRAAQMVIRWAHLGVWERLRLLAQDHGVHLGMTVLDGPSIRAHHTAAGAGKRGPTVRRAMS